MSLPSNIARFRHALINIMRLSRQPHCNSSFVKGSFALLAAVLATLLWSAPTVAQSSNFTNSFDAINGTFVPTSVQDKPLTKNSSKRLDQLTGDALQAISTGNWSAGLNIATALVEEFPDYSVGHWLLAESHNVLSMSDTLLQTLPNYSTDLIELLLEAQARAQQAFNNDLQKPTSNILVPTEIVQVGKHIDNVVLVDLESSILYRISTRGDVPIVDSQHYISSGEAGFGKLAEGDLKTPLGVYEIYGYRSDDSLPSLYGSGALMLNYPNTLDRSLGRTGSGIWLHGNPPRERSRSPRSSEGCVTMGNDHLTHLHGSIDMNRTQVILSHSVQWQPWSAMVVQRERYQELFEQYKAAWVHSHIDNLYSLYSRDALPEHVKHASEDTFQKVKTTALEHPALSPIGIALEPLSRVRPEDISLTINPSLDDDIKNQHLVMSFELPGAKKARITLYWERNPAVGYWQIRRETIDANEA